MRVLLVSPNRCRALVPPLPLGVAWVAGALRRAGHPTRVLDLMFAGDPQGELRDELTRFAPDLVGLSIRNIDDQDARQPTWYPPELLPLVEIVRHHPTAPRLVLGGAGYSMFPAGLLEYLDADYGIVGDGEDALVALVRALESGQPVEPSPHTLVRSSPLPGDSLPAISGSFESARPDHSMLDVRRYHDAVGPEGVPGLIPVQASRGCPWSCIYCATPRTEGPHWRLRDPAAIGEELACLAEDHGVRRVYFICSAFNHPPDHARAVCEEILRRRLEGLAWCALLTPRGLDRELVDLMVRAGLRMANVGNESGSNRMLETLDRGYTRQDVATAVGELRRRSVRVQCFLLLGGPGETRESVTDSVTQMEELRPEMVNVSAGLRIYPGTRLHEIALAEGVVEPGDDLLRPRFYLSAPTRDWLPEEAARWIATHPGWSV